MDSYIFLGIFIASFIIQLLYYFLIYGKVVFLKEKAGKEKKNFPLSVIISAKNEVENLRKFLPKILNQEYADFEVIVINDHSTDETSAVLSEFALNYKNLIVTEADRRLDGGNKKAALTKAISLAKNAVLIFTDADCYPVSKKWLQKIANSYSSDTEIILAYGAYEEKSGFLNKLIRFEALFNAMQYMSFALSGFPYMGVGRNLSYKKSLFIKKSGFTKHKNILSGDDDLFVNRAADKSNVTIITDPAAKTISTPENSFNDYLKQKKRHLSVGYLYKRIHKYLLGGEIFSRFLFYAGLLFFLFSGNYVTAVLTVLFFRFIVLLFFMKKFSCRMKEKLNIFFIFIFDILIPVINLFVSARFVFDKKILWK